MNCLHAYSRTWDFGPIIQKQDEEKPYWWFYRKCSKCGDVELFPSWKLNPGPRIAETNTIDLYMTNEELVK
jgi:hypothetical protein